MAKKKRLTAEDIITATDVKEVEVDVPEWGGTVLVRGFTKAEQQQARKEAMINGEIEADKLEMSLLVHGVVDPKFEEKDYDALKGKSAAAIDRILSTIIELSGIAPEEAADTRKLFRT